jgi:hypothetical protein
MKGYIRRSLRYGSKGDSTGTESLGNSVGQYLVYRLKGTSKNPLTDRDNPPL